MLTPFQANRIGLTRIETRPARSGDWSYVFFIDFDGHESQDEADAALGTLKTLRWRCECWVHIRKRADRSHDAKPIHKSSYCRTQLYKPGKPVDEVARELGINDIVKLASNENPRGPGAKVQEAIAAAATELSRYPDGGDLP